LSDECPRNFYSYLVRKGGAVIAADGFGIGKEAGLPGKEAGLPGKEAGWAEKEAGWAGKEAGWAEKEADWANEEADWAEKEAGLAGKEAGWMLRLEGREGAGNGTGGWNASEPKFMLKNKNSFKSTNY
jgi:hypothetical protein